MHMDGDDDSDRTTYRCKTHLLKLMKLNKFNAYKVRLRQTDNRQYANVAILTVKRIKVGTRSAGGAYRTLSVYSTYSKRVLTVLYF